MAKKIQLDETRYIELSIPQEVIADAAEIIDRDEMEASIIGRGEEEDSVAVGFNYAPEHRDSIMEILELIEDFNEEEEES